MKQLLKKTLFLFVLCFYPICLEASLCDYYIGVRGGVTWPQDRITGTDIKYKTGGSTSIFFGEHFLRNCRCEVEGNYRHNHIHDIVIDGKSAKTSGGLDVWSVYLNGYYDFYIDWGYCFVPYLGAGVGYSREKAHLHSPLLPDTSSTDSKATGQFIVGISFPLLYNFDFDIDTRIRPFDDDNCSYDLLFGIRKAF